MGATQLTLDNNAYGSESAWSFPAPRTLNHGSSAYSQTGSWTSNAGGFSGHYGTAAGGTASTATWTTTISGSDQGWTGGTEVSATWVPGAGNATNATYQIYDGSSTSGVLLGIVTVDQTKAPVGTSDGGSVFQELGDYRPQSGTLTVVLTASSASGTVVSDAIGIAPGWATGGGQSQYEPEPAYQEGVQKTGFRSTPDVSFFGAMSSGATCFQAGAIAYDYYGTSLSSPCWAGLIAIADQGRIASGGAVFDTPSDPTQALQAIYSLPSTDFHSIMSGYNGVTPTSGYDELTGLGTPIANRLIPDLVSYGLEQLAITAAPPSSVTAGSAFTFTATVENLSGAPLTTFHGNVTIAPGNNPSNDTLGGTLTVAAVNGVATFSGLTLTKAASNVTIAVTSPGATSITTPGFSLTPAAAARLVITAGPSTAATAGQALANQPAITEEDQYGNVETGDSADRDFRVAGDRLGPAPGRHERQAGRRSRLILESGRQYG